MFYLWCSVCVIVRDPLLSPMDANKWWIINVARVDAPRPILIISFYLSFYFQLRIANTTRDERATFLLRMQKFVEKNSDKISCYICLDSTRSDLALIPRRIPKNKSSQTWCWIRDKNPCLGILNLQQTPNLMVRNEHSADDERSPSLIDILSSIDGLRRRG